MKQEMASALRKIFFFFLIFYFRCIVIVLA